MNIKIAPFRRFAVLLFIAVTILSTTTSGATNFTVTSASSTGPGSLSQAIALANQTAGADRILFNVPGAGVKKIDLSQHPLPAVREAVTIDGYTQPGAKANSLTVGDDAVILIQLDGGGPSGASAGLVFQTTNCTVRGLSFTGFSTTQDLSRFKYGAAIVFDSNLFVSRGHVIEGNFIGVAPDGSTARGSYTGIFAGGGNDTIGGTSPAARNIIAGNRVGLTLSGAEQLVQGNYIGLDPTGKKTGFGNTVGVRVNAPVHIGGTAPGAGNIISNNGTGIILTSDATVEGNLIGPLAGGTRGFGNDIGIAVNGSRNRIGGLDQNEGNVIAYNGRGVSVLSQEGRPPATQNRILSNRFFANRLIAIDLHQDGHTPDDYLDADEGENTLQNFPVISSVVRSAAATKVTGGLNSAPSTSFTLQFFVNQPSSNPGQALLGTRIVTTSGAGDAPFDFTFPKGIGEATITATATDPSGNTSEFFPPNGAVQFANISTRATVGTGDNIIIAGFIIGPSGRAPTVLLRALGPSLNLGGSLADPQIVLRGSNGQQVAVNHDWKTSQEEKIRATGLQPADDREAAVVASLPSGQYTVQVSGADGQAGIAVVEVYVLNPLESDVSELQNISTRARVGTGDDVLIGGVIIRGDAAQRVIVRAIGPDLAAAGITEALPDPVLELHNGDGALIAVNDNWRTDQKQQISSTGIPPGDDRDAAIVAKLLPSGYTAIVRGKENQTGVALVEFYQLP
ncbi:MAG: hypothetical protein H0U23_00175 [Blastocatellia bacterium]|nr:hypothetical protein [Blastocatellia bacterium]